MDKAEELDIAGLQAALSSGGDFEAQAERMRTEGEKKKALAFIAENRCMQWDEDVRREIESNMAFISEKFPAEAAEARKLVADGVRIEKLCDLAWKAGMADDKAGFAELVKKCDALSPSAKERNRLDLKFKDGAKKRKAIAAGNGAKIRIPAPDYDVRGENPHFLLNLTPSSKWTVVMDETGKDFTSKAVAGGPDRGKYVAVVIPEESNLKRLSGGDHAKDASDLRTAELLTALYNARPYCGILGVTLDDMAAVSEYAHVNYWYNLIERTIDLCLRLVPLAHEGVTQFSFLVEGRAGEHSGDGVERMRGMAERALHACLYRLAKADPEREAAINAKISVEFKKAAKDKDFMAFNGYADALACAWAARDHKREIAKSLSAYGLRGICLLSGSAQNIAEYLDNVHQGIPMSPDGWTQMIRAIVSDGPDSIPGIVLGEFGERVKTSARLWRDYLDETLRHVDSHSINLRLLGAQISWLTRFMPSDMKLPPRLELLWLTVRLAHANHSGATEAQMKAARIDMDRFRELVGSLYEEDAPLACWATLHLAVQATDSFEFDRARKIVQEFLDIGIEKQEERGFFAKALARLAGTKAKKSKPLANPAAMGLRYYSQLLSSLGQHAAFEGDNATAAGYFRQAIDGFSRLSEDEARARETDQTTAYLATAAMDNPACRDADLAKIMRDYLGADPATAATQLAGSADSKLKYHHHILLRYIVSGRAPGKVVDAYRARHAKWAHADDGHPWELIEFYRALIVEDPEEKAELLRRAFDNARFGGPTLWVIACVILNALIPLDPSAAADFRRYLDEVKKALPALGDARIAALEDALATPVAPLDLARKVLPFNFR